MSTEAKNYMTKNYLVQEYIAEWEVDNLSNLGTKSMRTPIFMPIPNTDIKFCFEFWYQVIKMVKKEREVSCFKLVLLKLGKSETASSVKLKMDVTVNYPDGSLYQIHQSPASISVENIEAITCVNVTSEFYNRNSGLRCYEETIHKKRMASDKLIIKFHTKFYGHLCPPEEYYRIMDNLDNLRNFVKDFKSIYSSKAFCDVVFEVGSYVLPAHKSVLAAHSPVFLKMLEHDFVESQTNKIKIIDYNLETVENFLKYLYSGEIENKTWPFVKDLYTLSDKYAVQALTQDCANIIASSINIDHVCDILEMAYFYDEKKLKDEAIAFALQHFKELVSTAKWDALVINDPLIGYEILRIQSEALTL